MITFIKICKRCGHAKTPQHEECEIADLDDGSSKNIENTSIVFKCLEPDCNCVCREEDFE